MPKFTLPWKRPDPPGTVKVLVQKHPLAIRWFHWINFPVLFTMVWSGLLIFWANHNGVITRFGKPVFPEWFWAPPAPKWIPGWFPTYDTTQDGHPVRYLWTLESRLAEGMGYHFFFMWLFLINGLLYVSYLLVSREIKALVPTLKSLKGSILVVLHDLHLVKKAPPQGKYNDAQKIAYTGVVLLGFVMLVSGFAIYKPTQTAWLTNLLGGYVMARWIHFWTTMLIVAFFFVHVFQVIRTGWNNFRGMVTGWEIEKVVPDEPLATPQPSQEGAA